MIKPILFTFLLAGTAAVAPLTGPELEAWKATRASNDYAGIARAYADYMIDHGRDKNTGDFNRHANSSGHGPGGGMEFSWPASAMIATWAEAYIDKPDRLDIIGGPWQDRKDYAGFAVNLHGRMKRNDDPALQKRYRVAVLDTAELYMSINPEVQWAVWGENVANAIYLMLSAHELTGNAAYLHRADHFAQLAVKLFLDDSSPLPKLTSQDNYYEIESVTTPRC